LLKNVDFKKSAARLGDQTRNTPRNTEALIMIEAIEDGTGSQPVIPPVARRTGFQPHNPNDPGWPPIDSPADPESPVHDCPELPPASQPLAQRPQKPRKPLSPRQLAANRRNALKSTGPRTPAGKARASRNAYKHGLRVAKDFPCIPEECPATFALFRQEIRDTLQPRNTLQRTLFPYIVNLAWRLQRLPEAQAKIFECERARIPRAGHIDAPDLIAERCSEDPRNGFLLLNRYERSIENAFIRLLRLFREANGTEPLPLENLPVEMNPPDERTQSHPFASTYIPLSRLKNGD
jgi:hypothetical protein